MMGQQGYHPRHHHTRFYILMITLIVGGVFILLYLNNDGKGFSITNAIIKDLDSVSEDITAEDSGVFDLSSFTTTEKESEKNTRIFPFSLSFDKVPSTNGVADIESIGLSFLDLTTTITVNDDKLELNNLQQVDLLINDFVGDIEFVDGTLSLSGVAKRIEVNNIAFSSENEIKIFFEGLNYQSLKVSNVELKNLDFAAGNGQIKIGEKLSYSLEEDYVKILYFDGNINTNKGSDSSLLEADGNARGINIGGELLNVNLR